MPVRVLIVDNDHDTTDMFGMLLGLDGRTTHRLAYSGAEALSIAPSFRPELVLIDLGMPDMSGLALAQKLRELPEAKSAMLAAVTGYTDTARKDLAEDAGFDHYLIKPVTSDSLHELIETVRKRRDG